MFRRSSEDGDSATSQGFPPTSSLNKPNCTVLDFRMCILLLAFLIPKILSSLLSWLLWPKLLLLMASVTNSALFTNSRCRRALFGSWPLLRSYTIRKFRSLCPTLLAGYQGAYSLPLRCRVCDLETCACCLKIICFILTDICYKFLPQCHPYWPLLLSWPTRPGLFHYLLHIRPSYIWATLPHREDQEVALWLSSLRSM